ncbi:unnamed protein product [Laminaria digitata]
MGKARGPKRKEAPARKRLQAGNSGLLHKQTHRNQNGGAHRAAGLDGEAKRLAGKRTLSQQLLAPNKRSRGGKRRRKADGPPAKPGSSETAVIQAEYAAVDAREKAKLDADEAQRTRAPVRVRLAPATASLRMPSEGAVSMASMRASSSARMVEALLQSISDDPAPDAPPTRPVRSAGRKRKGNPFAALAGGGDDSDSEPDSELKASNARPAWRRGDGLASAGGGGGGGSGSSSSAAAAAAGLSFASPSDCLGFSHGGGSSGGSSSGGGGGGSGGGGNSGGVSGGAGSAGWSSSGVGARMAPLQEAIGGAESRGDEEDDPDL